MNGPRPWWWRACIAVLALAVSCRIGAEGHPSEYDILRSFPPGRLEALTASDMPDAQGFTGGNRTVGRWLEAGPQRGSCRAVIGAVVAGDLDRADRAWQGIEVAFTHQRADGGFTAETRPNGSSAAVGGAAVETAYFFLQEYGRAVLVIRESPHEAHFRDRIEALRPRLRRACDFIAAGEATILQRSRKAVNRVLIAAKAFGTCGRVLGDDALIDTSRRLVTEALRLRDANGVFIEHGGQDSSYNAVSLLFGQVLALHVPLPELDAAFPAAAEWQIGRVLVSGEVDNRGNTRTGVGLEPGFNGQPKGINHNEVILALQYHGLVHRNPAALEAADRVFAWTQRERLRTPWISGENRVVLDGRERRVQVDLPQERAPKAPLVLAFHGFTGSPEDLRKTSALTAAAQRRGWVVAYPEGTRDGAGRRFFQVGYRFHRHLPVDDVQAARELAGRLVRDLDLDPRAVFVTGFSNGADLGFLLGSRPNSFPRAIAPICGAMMSYWNPFLADSARPSVLAVNVMDDPITRWTGDRKDRDGWGPYRGTEEVVRAWVDHLDLTPDGVPTLEDGIRCTRWARPGGGPELRFFAIQHGGHRWPRTLGEPGRSTAETLLEFFEAQRDR